MATISRKAAKAMGIDVPDEPKRHKYGVAAKENRTWNGVTYDSKAEMIRAQELEILNKSAFFFANKRQVKVMLGDIPYVADFEVWTHTDRWFEDVKGVETPRFKLIKRLWPKYGPCPLVILKRKEGGWMKNTIYPEANP